MKRGPALGRAPPVRARACVRLDALKPVASSLVNPMDLMAPLFSLTGGAEDGSQNFV